MNDELMHYGILGMKWGIRKYQNPDGSLTPAGEARYARKMERKDIRWAKRHQDKIMRRAYKDSKREMKEYERYELDPALRRMLKSGKISRNYAIIYNRKLAEVMNTKVDHLSSPSGKAVRFIAKRGEIGVHMALADRGYDMSQFANGVFSSGKIAYRAKNVNMV